MPTAAKLIAALMFGALAWVASGLVVQILPEGMATGWMLPVNAFFGMVMGWRVMGSRAGDGFVPAIGYGLTTVFAIVFWCILIWAAHEMIRRAVRTFYDGPFDALQDMADIMTEYAATIVTPDIIGTLVIGGVICGMAAEAASRRWS